VNKLAACLKFARVLAHLLAGLFTILLVFPRLTEAQKQQRVQTWSAHLLTCFAIKLKVIGHAPKSGPLLLVANHISWLDITALHAALFCRFVAKSEVRQWPVIGFMSARAGTLFISRENRRDAMRVVHHMAERLAAAEVLAVFPEGTTSDGLHLLPFHGNLMQAAISANTPVQPVAIEFISGQTGQRSLAPCYIDDDTLLDSVWRTLCTPDLVVVLKLGDAQLPLERTRRELAHDMHTAVNALLNTPT
jgi:1-acyl-sn-glycerol-3-phosphate acyltransferase